MKAAAKRVVAVAGLVLMTALVWRHMDLLADTFWYVAHGRWVLDGRGLPDVDPFSFASVRSRFVVHMPGSVVLFAWLERSFGLFSLLVLGTAVEAAALALLWLGSTRDALARVAMLPVVAFAVILQREDLSARGQVFGDLLFVALLFVMFRMRDEKRVPWWVGLIFGAVWVNLHSSFLLAIVVPVLMIAASSFDKPLARSWVLPFVVFAAMALLGTLANPYGPRLVTDVLALASHPTTFEQKLFVSPDFTRWDTMGVFVLASLAAGGVLLAPTTRRSDVVVLAAFVGFGASALRYLPHLLYVTTLMLGEPIAFALRRFEQRAWAPRLAAGAALVALSLAIPIARVTKSPTAHVPVEAAAFVRDGGTPLNVLNEYHWGGFLLYAWMGKPKVFVDGRSYLYFNGVFDDHRALENLEPTAGEILEIYDFHTALLERGSALASALQAQPGWRKVHEDRLAVVFVRAR